MNIPQRFQAVNAASPTRAGVSLLPLLLMTPLASGVSGFLVSNQKIKFPPLYLIILGSILQLLGVALETSLGTNPANPDKQQYAYETIMGLGFGLVLSSLLTLIPLVVNKKDMPVLIGAVTQVRVLGGTIGLAISSVVLNSFVSKALAAKLSPEQIAAIGESLNGIEDLSQELQGFARTTFAAGYNRQTMVLTAFSAAVLVSCGLMWERVPRRHLLNADGEREEVEEGGS